MTQEEKAKAYDEALKKARQLCLYPTTGPFINDLQDLFPELKESEDGENKRISKEITQFLKQNNGWNREWLAWLEKQKESELSEDLGKYITELSKQFPEVSFAKLSRIAVRIKNWLEKQGEQKFELKSAEESLGISSEEYNDIVNECLYLYDELNSSDKIKPNEPKFHEGDWVVFIATKSVYQVEKIENYEYTLRHLLGGSLCLSFSNEKLIKEWTIKDAKDGDVLATDDGDICVFDGTVEEGKHPFAYCGLTARGFDSYDARLPFSRDNNIHPATKEQRTLLFQKMKEAGYEWDAENKELKKISQRMVSAEAKEALYDKPTDEEMKELLRTEYEKGRADTIAEMKSSWSIEDEKVIAIINNALTESNTPPDDYDKVYDWLESLRKRIGG